MPFLPPNQQRQSTEGKVASCTWSYSEQNPEPSETVYCLVELVYSGPDLILSYDRRKFVVS